MPKTTALKPISPAQAANFARAANRFQWTPLSAKQQRVGTFRTLVPFCQNPLAVQRFLTASIDQIARASQVDRCDVRSYGIEPDDKLAFDLRSNRIIDRVTCAPIDRIHYRESSVNAVWFEPPTTMDPQTAGNHFNNVFPAVHNGGAFFIVATADQLRACADTLARRTDVTSVYRLTGRSTGIVVVAATRTSTQGDSIADVQAELLDISDDTKTNAANDDVEDLPQIGRAFLPYVRGTENLNSASPILSLPYSPQALIDNANRVGSWNNPVVADIFATGDSHRAIKPIERLPEGHSAIIAANSMIDHLLIEDPSGVHNPVIIRGFFKKANRETFRTAEVVKRTDFYESNILAMDTVTGDIAEVGQTTEGLEEFMDAYGSAIRHNIDTLYPPTVDVNSPQYTQVGQRVDDIARPLIGKQRHAAIAGAIHLKKNPHLNFFATQGSGKTCTTAAMSAGMQASIVAVITPSRVVPNWVDEIRAVCPRAIIRVVRNDNPIGAPPAQPGPFSLRMAPAPFARASLEEIRTLFDVATPETPLWIILKKDTARATYPTKPSLREVWMDDEAPTELHLPLAKLVEAEKRAGASPMPGSSPNALCHPKHLVRSPNGRIERFKLQPASTPRPEWDRDLPTLLCPQCWHPIHNHPHRYDSLRDDRHQHCTNERRFPKFPKLTHEYQQLRSEIADDGVDVLMEPPASRCRAPLKQPTVDQHGRRIYSYGDYFAKHLVKKVDLVVIDESQDYKARDTLQGTTVRRIAQRAKRTIALTGTPFGGRVSDFFYQLIAFNPRFTQEFSYADFTRFNSEFGRQEITETLIQSPTNQNWHRSLRSIPGYHPKLLTYFWDNTIWMDLDDVDIQGILPSFTQNARLLEMDDQVQGTTGFSQKSAYAFLDDSLSSALSVHSNIVRNAKGKRRVIAQTSRISNYIQEMLTYPENAWMGASPRDPDTKDIIVTMPPLRDDWLYPKETELLSILERHRDLGRKCLVYCTHTKLRDVTSRLKSIIEKEGFRVLQLTSAIKQENRAAWLRREAMRNDVIICHPKLVETGINLIEYPTIIWYEIDHSMITTEQASARSYRINQTMPVEVYFLAYAGTMQEHALHLIAQKSDVSRTFRGDLSKNGLSAFNPTEDDVREEIARALLKGDYHNSRDSLPADVNIKQLERMFSETNIMAGESFFAPETDEPTAAAPEAAIISAPTRRRREPMPQSFTQPTLGI